MNKPFCALSIFLLLLSIGTGCGSQGVSRFIITPQPTATSQPTATLIPGWEKFEGGGAELWLPESYEGGDLSSDLDFIVENLRNLGGPEFEQIAQLIEENPSAFVLYVFDSKIGDSGFLTGVNVTKERVLSSVTLDTYIDMAVKQFPSEFHFVERAVVSLDRYEARRLVVELTLAGTRVKEVLYVVKEDNTIWSVTFATGADEFDQRLPTFEQSVRTFAVQP
ncbi:MAG TPA: hypothetical protein VFL17_02400 [Anaerolineae bacterium]|nr:hypothetical protein [Anaerolineae bacterium]